MGCGVVFAPWGRILAMVSLLAIWLLISQKLHTGVSHHNLQFRQNPPDSHNNTPAEVATALLAQAEHVQQTFGAERCEALQDRCWLSTLTMGLVIRVSRDMTTGFHTIKRSKVVIADIPGNLTTEYDFSLANHGFIRKTTILSISLLGSDSKLIEKVLYTAVSRQA